MDDEYKGDVWGFVPYWEDDELNLSPLSYVMWYGVEINSAGGIDHLYGWPVLELVNQTHEEDAKLILIYPKTELI